MGTRNHLLAAAVSTAIVCATSAAGAATADADYPKGPVTMVVPFPAGGPTDVLARLVGAQLAEMWKQPVVMDYKPGASTMLGTAAVARAAPDGHIIGVVNSAYVINPSLQKQMPYKNADLGPVTQLIRVPAAIAATPSAPFNTIDELVAYARKHPGGVTYASPGTGGTSHLTGELLARRAGFQWSHIPYKGSAPAHTDVIGGRVMVMIDPVFSLTPHVRSGRLKMLASTGAAREAGVDYAAVAETFPGFEVQALVGLVVPAGTPASIVDKIQRDVAKALAVPSVKERIEGLGMQIVASSPSAFKKQVDDETVQWRQVIRDARIPQE